MAAESPFQLITDAVNGKETVLVSMRNGHKLEGRVCAFDRHFNMILEDAEEYYFEGDKSSAVRRSLPHKRMLIRGDNVIVVIRQEKKRDNRLEEQVA